MKYTVVLRQAIPDAIRPALERQLMDRFGLNGEQAQRLAARTSGRLMKPTGRARAELLLQVFEGQGAQVALEEVREETGLLSEPFQGVGLTAAPTRAPESPDDAFLAPLLKPGDGPDRLDPTDPFKSAGTDHDPWGGRTAEFPGDAFPGDTFPGERGAPGTDWNAWSGSAAATEPLRGENNPFAGEFMPGADALEAATGPARSTELEGLANAGPDALRPDALAAGDAPGSLVYTTTRRSAPASETNDLPSQDASVDVWSDFTGSLTSTDAAGAALPTPEATQEAAQSVLFAPSEASSTLPRRSLMRQLTVSTLVPLALSTGLTLGLLGLILPGMQRQLVQQNAQAVAVAVGTSLNVSNQAAVENQLRSLLGNSSVGFIRVELPDGTGYFRSSTPDSDSSLQRILATQTAKNPELNAIRFDISPADAYREQLQQFEDVGAGNSAQARQLRKKIEDPANRSVDRDTYLLSRMGVTTDDTGRRAISRPDAALANLQYRVTVGVPTAQASATLRNTLLLLLGVSLLALGLAALLARRAAQRVAAPIERLVKVADAISMGDLTEPVKAESNDEIGDLAQALERMRQSLDAAMERLRRRKRG